MIRKLIRKLKILKFKYKYKSYQSLNWRGTGFLTCDVEIEPSSRIDIDSDVYFRKGCAVRVRKDAALVIGKMVSFNNNCIITCRDSIVIGSNVLIEPNVLIFDHDHDYKSDDFLNNFVTEPIIIEDNVWIGGNCTILKGTIIHSGAVIGAGTVVSGEVHANSVYINHLTCKSILYRE